MSLRFTAPDTLKLSGAIKTATAQAAFGRILPDLHGLVLKNRWPRFNVDVRELDFVNSSAIRLFVDWITWAESSKYTLSFHTSADTSWQRISFSVLCSLAPNHVRVVEHAASTEDQSPRQPEATSSRARPSGR
jgi:hypothetical protein